MDVNQIINEINSRDYSLFDSGRTKAITRFSKIAKPLNSMGRLEVCIHDLAGIQSMRTMGNESVTSLSIQPRCVTVFCADNGVVAEGVTQTGSEVTAVVANNMLSHKTSVCLMSEIAKVDVIPIDVGMITQVPNLVTKKVAKGTKNFAKEPAMTYEEACQTILTGFELAKQQKEEGYLMLATGEMGIGNTTTSSAIASVLLNRPVVEMTGRGAGLSKDGITHKVTVIEQAITKYGLSKEDPMKVLCCVGGFDIAGMVGMYLGAAYYHLPVVMDGFISTVAGLLATKLCPPVLRYLMASHVSKEPAATYVLEAMGKQPLICGDLCLGEGTGAVAAMPLFDMAMAEFLHMPTFDDIKIEEYKPL